MAVNTESGSLMTTADLPEPVRQRGIADAQWRTLANNLYPGAKPESVLMVWDYCIARRLDPMKKPCHIVPIRVKQGSEWVWRDVVMAGIYEYRITAQRTGQYLGHSKPEYGPTIDIAGIKAPEWCDLTIYRFSKHGDGRAVFPVRRYFAEVVGLKDGKANDRWGKAPVQMLEKCTEAAGLREAFPEEFGGEPTAEEMDDQRIEPSQAAPQPAQRKSQVVTVAPIVVDLPADVQDITPDPAGEVGVIAHIDQRDKGCLLKLDTGFQCATSDPELIAAAKDLLTSRRRVELITRPARDSKYAPKLVELNIVVTDVVPA